MKLFGFLLIAIMSIYASSPASAQAQDTKAGEVQSGDKNPERDDKAALKMLAWLPSVEQVTEEITTYLREKVGQEVIRPDYPSTGITYWQDERYPIAPAEGTLSPTYFPRVYRLLYEDTLVLRHLLKAIDNLKNKPVRDENAKQQTIVERTREVHTIANENFLWVSVYLKDKWLAARIAEAFLLRNLDAAPVEGNLNREILVERVAGAFWADGEMEKQVATLKVLIKVAHNINNADAARAKIAGTLATQGKYEEAITWLEPISDPSISALKRNLIPTYQQMLSQKQNQGDGKQPEH